MMNYQTITGFKKFAENSQVAGFDGVEVHCANGYLLDEFCATGQTSAQVIMVAPLKTARG